MLEPSERSPTGQPRQVAILEGGELARVLPSPGPQRQHHRPRHRLPRRRRRLSAKPSNAQASPSSCERLTLHSFRHAYASLLISKGLTVVVVSRQLGHANPSITLQVYAHLFERADHAHAARAAIDASYTNINTSGG